MKKRLRKKKRCGEFTQWGRQIVIIRNRKDGFDEFLDAFIEEAIEANGCYCGGGGKDEKLDVVVELGRRSDDPDARLKKITAWLKGRSDVEALKVGEEFDIWHGDMEEIEEQIEPIGAANAVGDGAIFGFLPHLLRPRRPCFLRQPHPTRSARKMPASRRRHGSRLEITKGK
jgi:uncharacterized protein